MGRPEDKERMQLRRRNHFAKDLRQIKIFHEKVREKKEEEKKINLKNYEDYYDDRD